MLSSFLKKLAKTIYESQNQHILAKSWTKCGWKLCCLWSFHWRQIEHVRCVGFEEGLKRCDKEHRTQGKYWISLAMTWRESLVQRCSGKRRIVPGGQRILRLIHEGSQVSRSYWVFKNRHEPIQHRWTYFKIDTPIVTSMNLLQCRWTCCIID